MFYLKFMLCLWLVHFSSAKNASGQEKMQVDEKTRPTEEKKEEETAPLYVSPFVTMSRGKTSARKEYQQKKSPECKFDCQKWH